MDDYLCFFASWRRSIFRFVFRISLFAGVLFAHLESNAFAGETPAQLVAPSPGTILSSSRVTFEWTPGEGSGEYTLAVGTSVEALDRPPFADLFYYQGTETAATAHGIPKDGSTIYVRLWSEVDSGWRYEDHSFRTEAVVEEPARLTSPPAGSVIAGGEATFEWTSGESVTSYRIAIATSVEALEAAPGGDIYVGGEVTETRAEVAHIPRDGSTIHVRLYSKIDGRWQSRDYSYATELFVEEPAQLVWPPEGATLSSFTQLFWWTPGTNVSEYKIAVGTTPESLESGGDVYVESLGQETSVVIPGIPLVPDSVYVRLWSRIEDRWSYHDYEYATAPPPEPPVAMVEPAPGSTISSISTPFRWTTSQPVTEFKLEVATTPALLEGPPWADVYYGAEEGLSADVFPIPLDGKTLYVRLRFQVLDRWFHEDYQYPTVEVRPAELLSPLAGDTLSDNEVTFTWDAGSGADSYVLAVASRPELLEQDTGFDIFGYAGTDTSALAPAIPLNGEDVHVRLWSQVLGVWYHNDYRLHTVPDIAGPGTYDRSIGHEGLVRGYRVHVPAAYDGQHEMPMVVALHGNQDSPEGMERLTGLATLAEREGFIVLYPEASVEYDRFWFDGRFEDFEGTIDEVGFIRLLVDLMDDTLAVDETRVYATGFSGGAALTNKLGMLLHDRIAAIAPVAGTVAHGFAQTLEVERPVPVMYFHGTDDPFAYYYEGGSMGTREGASLTAVDLASWWAHKNRVLVNGEVEVLDAVDDDTAVSRHTYRNEAGEAIVVFHSVEGGGHTWPSGWQWESEALIGPTSQEVDATEAVWAFFQSFSLDSESLEAFIGYPFEWPPVWRGASRLSCQWARRALAHHPAMFRSRGYAEDNHVTYLQWGFPSGLPEGTTIFVEGEFPYARHFNFQINPPWDPRYPAWRGGRGAQPIVIVDRDIEPDEGHVNPVRDGAYRYATNRRYHLEFELVAAPAEDWDALNDGAVAPPYRAPGNRRVGGHRSGRYGELGPYIEMRISAPDRYQPYAGVAPPVVWLQLPGEAPRLAPPVAELYRYPRGEQDAGHWVELPYRPEDNPCLDSGWAAKDWELWQKRDEFVQSVLEAEPSPAPDPRSHFYRLENGVLRQLKLFGVSRHSCAIQFALEEGLEAAREFCPEAELTLYGRGHDQPPPRNDEHTNGIDMHGVYLLSVASPQPGEVLVFQGKAPATTPTLDGPGNVSWTDQLRYWSVCTLKEGVVGLNCVMDENVARDALDYHTIVIGDAAERPVNARPECGITFLPLLADDVNILWRMKSTGAFTWEHAPQEVAWADGDLTLESFDEDAVRSVMVEYYPEGRYLPTSEVEALGCDKAVPTLICRNLPETSCLNHGALCEAQYGPGEGGIEFQRCQRR